MATNIHNSGKKIKFDCVDTWKGSWEHNLSDEEIDKHMKTESLRWIMKNLKKKNLFKQFTKNIEPVKHIINPVKMESVQAARLYKDKSIDFIMIDGAHDGDNMYQDLKAWMPKLKKKGSNLPVVDNVKVPPAKFKATDNPKPEPQTSQAGLASANTAKDNPKPDSQTI